MYLCNFPSIVLLCRKDGQKLQFNLTLWTIKEKKVLYQDIHNWASWDSKKFLPISVHNVRLTQFIRKEKKPASYQVCLYEIVASMSSHSNSITYVPIHAWSDYQNSEQSGAGPWANIWVLPINGAVFFVENHSYKYGAITLTWLPHC